MTTLVKINDDHHIAVSQIDGVHIVNTEFGYNVWITLHGRPDVCASANNTTKVSANSFRDNLVQRINDAKRI